MATTGFGADPRFVPRRLLRRRRQQRERVRSLHDSRDPIPLPVRGVVRGLPCRRRRQPGRRPAKRCRCRAGAARHCPVGVERPAVRHDPRT